MILVDKTQWKHMHYIARKCLKKVKANDLLHRDLEEEKTTELLNYAHRNGSIPFYELLVIFSQKLQHNDVLHVIARILLMLLGDAAMSSVPHSSCMICCY